MILQRGPRIKKTDKLKQNVGHSERRRLAAKIGMDIEDPDSERKDCGGAGGPRAGSILKTGEVGGGLARVDTVKTGSVLGGMDTVRNGSNLKRMDTVRNGSVLKTHEVGGGFGRMDTVGLKRMDTVGGSKVKNDGAPETPGIRGKFGDSGAIICTPIGKGNHSMPRGSNTKSRFAGGQSNQLIRQKTQDSVDRLASTQGLQQEIGGTGSFGQKKLLRNELTSQRQGSLSMNHRIDAPARRNRRRSTIALRDEDPSVFNSLAGSRSHISIRFSQRIIQKTAEKNLPLIRDESKTPHPPSHPSPSPHTPLPAPILAFSDFHHPQSHKPFPQVTLTQENFYQRSNSKPLPLNPALNGKIFLDQTFVFFG